MKRLLPLAVLCITAIFALSSLASGQTPTPTARAYTNKVTAKTTPTRDRTRPYSFRTTGKIVPPSNACPPKTDPGPGASNCAPPQCPPGTTNPAYCVAQGPAQFCTGKVSVRFKRGANTISVRRVNVRSDCTYRSRVRFADKKRQLTKGKLNVTVRFLGNPSLYPRSATKQYVYTGRRR